MFLRYYKYFNHSIFPISAYCVLTVIVSAVVFVAVVITLWVAVTQLTCRNTQSITDTSERIRWTCCTKTHTHTQSKRTSTTSSRCVAVSEWIRQWSVTVSTQQLLIHLESLGQSSASDDWLTVGRTQCVCTGDICQLQWRNMRLFVGWGLMAFSARQDHSMEKIKFVRKVYLK